MNHRKPPWADLPQELLSTIADFLTSNPISMDSFRSVCNSWRSSCPRLSRSSLLSPNLPLCVPAHYFESHGYFLTVTVIYALRRPLQLSQAEFSSLTPTSWILFLHEFNAGKLFVHKPFATRPYFLPLNFPKSINLIDFNARELGRFYSHRTLSDIGTHDKVVLFPDGFAVVVLFDQGKLMLTRLNIGITEWELIHDGNGLRFDDIVEFKGRVFGIDRRGRVYEIDCHSFDIKQVIPAIFGGGGRRKRLVESLGFLYLVVRCNVDPGKTNKKSRDDMKTKFKVYELDEKKKKWFEITSLGDRSFFFGLDFSFSASAEDLGSCGKNCILFKKESFESYCGYNDDYKVFSKLGSSDFDIGVCHLDDVVHYGAIESYPGYLDTLWPPPPWIWPIDRLKRLEMVETQIHKILNGIPHNIKTRFECIVNGGVVSCEGRRELSRYGGLEYWKRIQRIKDAVNKQKLTEKNFPLLREHRELRDTLNELQMKKSLVLAQTGSLVTEEDHNCVDEMQSSIKRLSTNLGLLLNKIRVLFVKQNAQILEIEENASKITVRYAYSYPMRVWQFGGSKCLLNTGP